MKILKITLALVLFASTISFSACNKKHCHEPEENKSKKECHQHDDNSSEPTSSNQPAS